MRTFDGRSSGRMKSVAKRWYYYGIYLFPPTHCKMLEFSFAHTQPQQAEGVLERANSLTFLLFLTLGYQRTSRNLQNYFC